MDSKVKGPNFQNFLSENWDLSFPKNSSNLFLRFNLKVMVIGRLNHPVL